MSARAIGLGVLLGFALGIAMGAVLESDVNHSMGEAIEDEVNITGVAPLPPSQTSASTPARLRAPLPSSPTLGVGGTRDASPIGIGVPGTDTDDPTSLFARAGWIDVQIDDRLTNAVAYIRPAGARGRGDDETPITVSLQGDEPTRIPVPIAGRYDVGLLAKSRAAVFVRDVDVEAGKGTPVTFDVPATGEVSFSLTGVPLPDDVYLVASLLVQEPDATKYPGRGQRARRSHAYLKLNGPGTLLVPPGTRYRVSIVANRIVSAVPPGVGRRTRPARDVRCVPSRAFVQAGEHVSIELRTECALHVKIDGTKRPGALVVALSSNGNLHQSTNVRTDIDPIPSTTLWGPRGRAELRWSGSHWAPASRTVELIEGIEGRVTISPTPRTPTAFVVPQPAIPYVAPPEEAPPLPTTVRFSPAAAKPGDEHTWIAVTGANQDGEQTIDVSSTSDDLYEFDDELHPPVVSAVRKNLVAEGVPLTRGRPQKISLQPGGFLILTYGGAYPLNLEKLRIEIRRQDGLVLWQRESHATAFPEAVRRSEFHVGSMFGPLLPGPVSFVVSSGGVDLGTVSATVKPGVVRQLTIR